jgi:Cu2+-exporting ATPase
MIYGLTSVLAIYASVRVYEHYIKSNKEQDESESDSGIEKEQEHSFKSRLKKLLAKTDENEQNKHFVKMSGVSIVVSSARLVYPPLALPSMLLFTYTAIPYLRQTEKSLFKNKKIDGYVLYSIADLMMLEIGAYASASIGVGLLHLSRYILSNAKERSKRQLVNIFNQQPDMVWLLKHGVEVQVPIDQVKANDILVVDAGDIIPVDGTVVEGIAAVDQKVLTGEAQPADKAVGDRVYASTMVLSGRINILMEYSGEETLVAKIGEIINQSIEFKGSQALKGEKWADSFTTPMLVLGLLGGPFLGPAGTVGILYCHIANTIRVVAPLSTLNYLNIAVRNNILVKDGHVLEELIHIDTFIFDKTGTLTQELPKVGQIILCSKRYTEEEVLFYAAVAEQKSVHPIARAIVSRAEEQQMELPGIHDSSYDIGYGITVEIDDKTIQVGSSRFMQMKGVSISKKVNDKMEAALARGHSVIMLAINSKLEGLLEIHTIVRSEAAKTIELLREIGVKKIVIVSGDQEMPTKALAESLGIKDYYFNILPEDKAKIVEKYQDQGGKVAFVGDGVNDAIAMEEADASISLSGASSIATDVAQVVLMDGSLTHLPTLIELSRKLDKNLSRSLVMNIVPNVIALNGVLFFHFGMLTTMLVSQSPLVMGTVNALLPVDSNGFHDTDGASSEPLSSTPVESGSDVIGGDPEIAA